MTPVLRCTPVAVMLLTLVGCVAYTMVTPGTVTIEDLQVSPSVAWNKAPRQLVGNLRTDSETWTRDGLFLDRLVFIPAVGDGETLFSSRESDAAFPEFRASMLPNEIEELVESSIVKVFGEGQATVSTSGLRPHRFGSDRGILFDMDVAVSDGPGYRGLVGAFVVDQRLYTILYIAAEPYYFERNLADAESIIEGARRLDAGGD